MGDKDKSGSEQSSKREEGRRRRRSRRNRFQESANRGSRQQNRLRKGKLTTKLSEHFSKEDFWTQDENGKNKLKISLGLVGALESLWGRLNKPITIVKGYVTPEQAEKEGNWKRNFHMMGMAADICVKKMSLEKLFLEAEKIKTFRGIGLDLENGHVHVDVRHQDERVLWVVQNNEEQELTASLREQVFCDFESPVQSEDKRKPSDSTPSGS